MRGWMFHTELSLGSYGQITISRVRILHCRDVLAYYTFNLRDWGRFWHKISKTGLKCNLTIYDILHRKWYILSSNIFTIYISGIVSAIPKNGWPLPRTSCPSLSCVYYLIMAVLAQFGSPDSLGMSYLELLVLACPCSAWMS